MKTNVLSRCLALALGAFAVQANAQGQALQGPLPPQPQPSDAAVLPAIPAAPPAQPVRSGPSVVLKAVEISGNTLVDSDSLLAELGEVAGKSFDMAGLNALTDRIEARYRLAGYPFTRLSCRPRT